MTPDSAKAWAENLCSRAEYASGEIHERLVCKGLTPAQADAIVASLVERRFIDDARFARAFVRDKTTFARWGRAKVAAALARKRVPRNIIDDALADLDDESYITSLVDLLEAKLRSLKADPSDIDYPTKVRIYRFAASRGFGPADVGRALRLISDK